MASGPLKFTILGLDVDCFADYHRAVQLHSLLQVKLQKAIDVPVLKQIVQQYNYTYMEHVFKALYLVSFYSFLRLCSLVALTDNRVRGHFPLILSKLHLSDSGFTFYTFRSSGATFAFNNEVTLQNIQRHGTWTLD